MSFVYRLNAFAARHLPVKMARLAPAAPLASFTFDDFPRSAWTVGGEILERFGVKATYYAVGGYCGRTVDGIEQYTLADLQAVHAAGHEIGCHTFSHQHGPAVSSTELKADIALNAFFLRDSLGEDFAPQSFAYPYGEVSARTKRLFGEAFPTARGIYPGSNGGWADLAQLKAVPLEARSWSAQMVEDHVRAARAAGSWLVFFSHDVTEAPSPYGCTPTMLEHALACVRDAGLTSLPIKDALVVAAARQ